MDLSDSPNRTLTKFPYMDFDRFQVINTTSSIEKGYMNSSDIDCAPSSPNAIHNIPQEHQTPAIIKSNEVALAAMGLSKYFDLVSIAAKPLTSNMEFAYVEMNAWEIDGKHAKNVHSLLLGFYLEDGAFPVFELSPREFIEGWGEKVNWIELQASVIDDEGIEYPWEFLC